MKRPKETTLPPPQYDYDLALQTAVSWLGDRHLLAQPVPRRRVKPTPFLVAQPRPRNPAKAVDA